MNANLLRQLAQLGILRPRSNSLASDPRAPHARRQRPIVLVVDDEDAILRWLTQSLQASGYEPILAKDAASTFAFLKSSAIDALILDVRLVGHSGLDILEHVRADRALTALPVIILTGVTTLSEAEEETIRRHRAFVFYKPQGTDEILDTLDRLVGKV